MSDTGQHIYATYMPGFAFKQYTTLFKDPLNTYFNSGQVRGQSNNPVDRLKWLKVDQHVLYWCTLHVYIKTNLYIYRYIYICVVNEIYTSGYSTKWVYPDINVNVTDLSIRLAIYISIKIYIFIFYLIRQPHWFNQSKSYCTPPREITHARM